MAQRKSVPLIKKLDLFRCRIIRKQLMQRYCIHCYELASIGLGLQIVHPMSIAISYCEIGENFRIYQNCTVGAKKKSVCGKEDSPVIGNNVTMYASSLIIGPVHVHDDVQLAANSCLVSDATKPGLYTGTPAVYHETKEKWGGSY